MQCGDKLLDFSRPQIMGILNITPDSFSDGGQLFRDGAVAMDSILRRAEAMITDGAAILDVGGESTRPGAVPVSESEELDRVIPVIDRLSKEFDVITSVDTSSAEVMSAAASHGVGLINDVRALSREGALAAAANSQLPVCLMHMQGQPGTMQENPSYNCVVDEVMDYLQQRAAECIAVGVDQNKILFDPGFGFGKTLENNLDLLRHLPRFVESGFPVLVGLSRKSMIGKMLDREVDQRLAGSLALALMAVDKGARILRVHDVKETADAITIWLRVNKEEDNV